MPVRVFINGVSILSKISTFGGAFIFLGSVRIYESLHNIVHASLMEMCYSSMAVRAIVIVVVSKKSRRMCGISGCRDTLILIAWILFNVFGFASLLGFGLLCSCTRRILFWLLKFEFVFWLMASDIPFE